MCWSRLRSGFVIFDEPPEGLTCWLSWLAAVSWSVLLFELWSGLACDCEALPWFTWGLPTGLVSCLRHRWLESKLSSLSFSSPLFRKSWYSTQRTHLSSCWQYCLHLSSSLQSGLYSLCTPSEIHLQKTSCCLCRECLPMVSIGTDLYLLKSQVWLSRAFSLGSWFVLNFQPVACSWCADENSFKIGSSERFKASKCILLFHSEAALSYWSWLLR